MLIWKAAPTLSNPIEQHWVLSLSYGLFSLLHLKGFDQGYIGIAAAVGTIVFIDHGLGLKMKTHRDRSCTVFDTHLLPFTQIVWVELKVTKRKQITGLQVQISSSVAVMF